MFQDKIKQSAGSSSDSDSSGDLTWSPAYLGRKREQGEGVMGGLSEGGERGLCPNWDVPLEMSSEWTGEAVRSSRAPHTADFSSGVLQS